MKYLIYISTACKLLNQDELLDILTVSRKNNERNELTGMLLYGEGTFIQILEGDAHKLDQTYKTITADPRHKNIITMTESEADERSFPQWSMGFKSVNSQEMSGLGGYIDPKDPSFLREESANAIVAMMKTFADANRMS